MHNAQDLLGVRAWVRWAGLIVVPTLLLAGCNSPKQPVYGDKQGFRFSPPSGWVERARDDAMPARSGNRHQDIPLPPLGGAGKSQERLLVRYDRLAAGYHAWLRVTVADVPLSMPLMACLAKRSPERGWKRESAEESLEVSGLPAARVAFVGRWDKQDYLCETVAVRKGENVYFITASFPASESTAREQVRQAVAGATWQ
jgi:hypothetical protein